MPRVVAIAGQAVLYAAFAVILGYFSQRPAYQHLDPQMAVIKLSFSHAGEHREECRRLTPEEIARLAPNMRRPMDCKRERVPLLVEIILDGEPLLQESLPPGGLSKDVGSHVYRRFSVPPGSHTIIARLRDSRRTEGFDYEQTERIMLRPQQNFVIDFKPGTGGFTFL